MFRLVFHLFRQERKVWVTNRIKNICKVRIGECSKKDFMIANAYKKCEKNMVAQFVSFVRHKTDNLMCIIGRINDLEKST